MLVTRRKLVAFGVASCLISGMGFAAKAQQYPSKATTIVVPFPPGGATDILGRVVAERLSRQLGQPFVIENRPGAAGVVGATQVSRSRPDGYTLLMAATGAIEPPAGTNASSYDVREHFTPIALIAAPPYVLVVNADIPANSVGEFINYVRDKQGEVSFGSSGVGAASHLAGELFKAMTGLEIVHVPYRGMGQAVTALLSGEVPMAFAPAPAVISHVDAGRLKVLGVTSSERSPLFPDYPTISESGVPGYEAVGWFGLFGPPGLPSEIVDKLNSEVRIALTSSEVKEQLKNMGAIAADISAADFSQFINDDTNKWRDLMEKAGIKRN